MLQSVSRFLLLATFVAVAALALGDGPSPDRVEAQTSPHEFSGLVVDENGSPVEGLLIAALAAQGGDGLTAAGGVFRLRLVDGTYRLYIWSSVYDSCTVSGIENPEGLVEAVLTMEGEDVTSVRIVVVTGARTQSPDWVRCHFDVPRYRVQGTVRGPDKRPLEGIGVRLQERSQDDDWGLETGERTGPDGMFTINVPAGSYLFELAIEAEGGVGCRLGLFGTDGRRARPGDTPQLVVSNQEVTGIEIALTETPANLCRTAPFGPPGVIHFSGELTGSQRERITNDVRHAEQILADRFGVEQDRYTLYVAQDWSDAWDLLTEHGRTPSFPSDKPSGGCPGISDLLLVNRSCYGDPSRAGYSVAQAAVSSARRTTPLDHDLWFGFVAYVAFAVLGPEREAGAVTGYISEARAFSVPLAETYDLEIRVDTRPLKFLAVVYLAETFGDRSLIKYFESLSTGADTETALQHAFGLSLDEFHANFESHRHVVAPPISSESDRIILLGQEALAQADEVRRIVSAVEQWFEETFAYPAGNAVWRVDSQDDGCGLASSTAIRIGKHCLLAEAVYAHEYFHALQGDWSTPEGEGYGSTRSYPPFMREGSATFVGNTYITNVSELVWSDIRAGFVAAVSGLEIALDDPTLQSHPRQPEYSLGALATEWLEARSGGKSVADYYYALSQQELNPEDGDLQFDRAGERAFREFWGMSTDEFYRQFACWRDRGFPVAEVGNECVGTVRELALSPMWTSFEWLGSDGTAIDDASLPGEVVVVYTWDDATGSWLGYFSGLADVPGLNTLTTFSAGATYWIAAEEAVTWTITAQESGVP